MIDILTAVVLLFFIWRGYKNGLMKSAYRLVSFLLGIILAYLLYPYVKDIILGSTAGEAIRSLVRTKYVEPGLVNGSLDVTALPEYMKSMVTNGQIVLTDALTGFFSSLVINITSFLLVFIVSLILISIIGKILHIVSKLPVIRFFDRGLGIVFGLVEGFLIIYVALALAFVVTPLRENDYTQRCIADSVLTKHLYENNPIVNLVEPTDYDNLSS
ncbi:MAG TPA: CvpA family protein [Candidatus Monoglobus merdigallinarum]|uniref:CvpA family protein n=1 Tax=Candidatus Monoglobus merdigallinarum TaxID=2838698 RepID=A0A9D1TLH4_9FIRM|nr:CvpA family protein [Candidatus Monoglobus merdigallinarum]